jgi:hypothetical protein
MAYHTINEALGVTPVVLSETVYGHNGAQRTIIKVRKPAGRKVYEIIRYENGVYSSAVPA